MSAVRHFPVNWLSCRFSEVRSSFKKEFIRENHRSGKDFSIGGGAIAGTGVDRSNGGPVGWQAGAKSGECRCPHRAIGGAGGCQAAGAREEAARDWTSRRGSGQYRSGGGDAQGHCGDEYPRGECGGGGGADTGDDAGYGTAPVPGGRVDARGEVGEKVTARNGAAREDIGHYRAWPGRYGSGAPSASVRHGAGGTRSVRVGCGGEGTRDSPGGSR